MDEFVKKDLKRLKSEQKMTEVTEHFKKVDGLIKQNKILNKYSVSFAAGYGLTAAIFSIIDKKINWLSIGIGALLSGISAIIGKVKKSKAKEEKKKFIKQEDITDDNYEKLAAAGKELVKVTNELNFAKNWSAKKEKKMKKYFDKREVSKFLVTAIDRAFLLSEIIDYEKVEIPEIKNRITDMEIIKGLTQEEYDENGIIPNP